MFTGIVTETGKVRRVDNGGDLHVQIGISFSSRNLNIGASVACSGICLTVIDRGDERDRWFAVTVSAETLSKTTAGAWSHGTLVNLERPLRVGDELGGHIVTGHIDGTAELVTVIPEGESLRMTFAAPGALAPFIAPKGSIALDGVSLTINTAAQGTFQVNVIPHTLKVTTLGQIQPGDRVNVEIDLIARYVRRLLQT